MYIFRLDFVKPRGLLADKSVVGLFTDSISPHSGKRVDFTLVNRFSADKKHRLYSGAVNWPAFWKPTLFNRERAMVLERKSRQLVLNKTGEKFIFRYQDGRENELLDALIEQAQDKRTSFDWFDAAVLSFKLTQVLLGQADELLRQDVDTPVQANHV